jgi:hypothetical protein
MSDWRQAVDCTHGFIGHFDTACHHTLLFTIAYTDASVHSHVFTAVAW